MTKVWVVTRNDWDVHSVAGVFTDKAGALGAQSALAATLTTDPSGPSYDIDDYELDQLANWAIKELARKGPPPK